jgi:ribosomal-protein-alanine N-acetyltransferase
MSWSTESDLQRLVERFYDRTLSHAEWTHQAHLAVGTWHVHDRGPVRALTALQTAIRALNDVHGTPNSDTRGYHETITRAYVCLIADVLATSDATTSLEAVHAVMESFAATRDVLLCYYSRDCLMSTAARRGWVPPDISPLQAPEWPRAITTPRLRLRSPEPEDAAALAALMTPGVSAWLASWPAPLTAADAAARISDAIGSIESGDGLHYVVTRRDDGAIIGWSRVERVLHDGRRADLGFWLSESFHGQGYMTEAARATCAAAFKLLDVDVIEAGAQRANTPSLRVLEKLGMQRVEDRDIFAPARVRHEPCAFFEMPRAVRPAFGQLQD